MLVWPVSDAPCVDLGMQVQRLGNWCIEIRSLWSDSAACWGGRVPVALLAALVIPFLIPVPAAFPETWHLWRLTASPLVFGLIWKLLDMPRTVVVIDFLSRELHIARPGHRTRNENYGWRDVAKVTLQFVNEDESEARVWLHLRSGRKVILLNGVLRRADAEHAASILCGALWPDAPLSPVRSSL